MEDVLLRLARVVTSDLPALLADAAAALSLTDLRITDIDSTPSHALLLTQRCIEHTEVEGSMLLAGIWRGGVLSCVLECVRPPGSVWTDADRAGAAALADRASIMLDRDQSEQALRASEDAYRTIFDSSNDAIFVHDIDTGAIIEANRTACVMSGVTLDELRQRGIALIGDGPPPYTAKRALEYLGRAAAGEPQRFEWCTYHALSGTEVWVEVSLQRVTIHGRDRLLALVRDIRDRKQAERALVESEEAYRTIFQNSAEAIWVHDAQTGDMLDVNAAGCEMYGYTRDEMMRVTHRGLLYPGSAEYSEARQNEVLARALAGDSPRFEWMGLHKDGSATWGEVTLRRVTVSGGDRILATVRDIRERKEAEAALRRAHDELEQRVAERTAELAETNMALEEEIAEHEVAREQLLDRTSELEGVFRALPDLYFRTDRSGTVLDFRAGDTTRLALAPDMFVGQRLQDVLPRDVGTAIDEALASLGRSGELVHFEYALEMPYGLTDFEARFVPLGAEQVIIVVRDITVRKRAEDALRRSEEHFRRLIENSSDLLMICDTTGAVTYMGPSVEWLLGWKPEELLGTRPADMLHPEDVERVMNDLRTVVDNPGLGVVSRFRIRHRDGSWRVFENLGKTLSPTTAAEGVVANGRDITERSRAEEALRQATAAAEQANRAKSEFLSRMSHELRTPMNSILGFAQVLEADKLPARQDRCVQHILRGGRHLLGLINEVLDLSRIEAGGQNLSLEPVRLSAVVNEVIALARPMADQARVQLEHDDRGTGDHVHADRQRLSQILLNLLSNGIKYNHAGGRVVVSAERHDEAGAHLVRVRIADTGRGIAGDRQNELFTPFARLGAENSEIEGTGLGLALSKRLTDAMGGQLYLESSGPGGSVFALDLMATQSPLDRVEDTVASASAAATSPHRPATLLYIEDNLANLSLVETVLWSRPNWRTVPALQGQIGVELAREHLPDLILLDLHLPDISGDEVLRRLRADERTAGIPVLVISADATQSARERLLHDGAAAFLTKPLDVAEFLATMDRLLSARAASLSA